MQEGTPTPRLLWWASIPVVAAVVTLGVWVTGAVLSNDELIAKGLTVLWLLAAGVGAALLAWKFRTLAVPVLGTYLLVAGGLTGFLLYTSTVDQIVNEDVLVADAKPTAHNGGVGQATKAPTRVNAAIGKGTFVDGEHPTSGVATLIDTISGDRVLTLTEFTTDPGPDLRVYLTPGDGRGVEEGVDLGALKGNKGNQQYSVPKSAPSGQVVIWCRAFSVQFGSAALT